jgi:hypothetical protein
MRSPPWSALSLVRSDVQPAPVAVAKCRGRRGCRGNGSVAPRVALPAEEGVGLFRRGERAPARAEEAAVALRGRFLLDKDDNLGSPPGS